MKNEVEVLFHKFFFVFILIFLINSEMEKFLDSQRIPRHLQELLKLVGVVSLTDLQEINEEFVATIERQVRQGGFNSEVDFHHAKIGSSSSAAIMLA